MKLAHLMSTKIILAEEPVFLCSCGNKCICLSLYNGSILQLL